MTSVNMVIVVVLALVLALMGVYFFPISKASFRITYAKVPESVVASLSAFRRRDRLRRFRHGSVTWIYYEAGTGGDVILFLHGMGGSGDIWFQQIEALEKRYRCLSVSYPPVPTLDQLCSGILGILAHERVVRLRLIGSSMGGYLAQLLMATAPGLIHSAVLSNTFPPNDIIPQQAGRGVKYLPWVPEWAIMAGMRKNTERVLYPAAGNCELVKAYLYEQTCGNLRKQDFIARCACLCQAFLPPDPQARGIPLLIIESDNDPVVNQELRALLRTTYPSAAVKTFHQAGHFPYLNRPVEYTRTLEEFLA
jgi:maspardin